MRTVPSCAVCTKWVSLRKDMPTRFTHGFKSKIAEDAYITSVMLSP
jgi:hypothetical protein